ncbi:MAG TPA: CHAD domain-containing protein [Caldilineaceae bacterium]|nr:CHAD domain-containing protein [Caldilineaceae bacterium]
MSYRLQSGESPAIGLKRIADEQVQKALKQLHKKPDGENEAIHDARKRFKKIRAVLRVVRDEIGEEVYQRENHCYRDAGRRLAPVRDRFVLIETVDALHKDFAKQLEDEPFGHVRSILVEEHVTTLDEALADDLLAEVAVTIEAAQQRIAGWPIAQNNYDPVHDSLKRIYKRGYKAMAAADDDPSPATFHEWRKRVKYFWYSMRILKPLWPNLLDEWADEIHALANVLGDSHDLAVLQQTLHTEQWRQRKQKKAELAREIDLLCALAEQRRQAYHSLARPMGQRNYAEKPKRLVKRIGAYWAAWSTLPSVKAE